MVQQIKKLNDYRQPLWIYILSPKRGIFIAIAALIFTAFGVINLDTKVNAATGINPTINFQGKVVNSNGTNVADGQYTFVFRIYNVSSGGTHLWTETQSNVQVTAGVFRVSLGSVQSFSGIDFNSDTLYLGVNFNSDGEMTPRVRFASVPYAFNAQTVAGLTVTDTTGTLTIPDSKTIEFGGAFTTSAHDLSLTMSGNTTLTLPATGTLATLGGVETLSNKSFSSTVTFDGVATDITTDTNENLTISPNGTGNVLIQTGAGGQAALAVDKTGAGDIFAASSSGIPKFVIKDDGNASSSAGFTVNGVGSLQSTDHQTLTIGGGTTGDLVIGRVSQATYLPGFENCTLKTTAGGLLDCGSDNAGSSGDNFWQYNPTLGIVANGNLTTDLLLGGISTDSAKFAILGVAADTPVASVSAIGSGRGISLSYDGSIQTTLNQTLTIGGNTTGDITLSPLGGNGKVTVDGTLEAATGGTATVTVAASDSSERAKAQADFVADGTSDETEINAAIASLPSSGGIVQLLEGNFSVDGTILVNRSDVTLRGSGKGTVITRGWNEASLNTSGVITLGDASGSYSDITISDLSIDGNKTNYTNAENHGVLLRRNISHSKISNTQITNNRGRGVYLYGTSGNNSYIEISSNDIRSNDFGGITNNSSNYTRIFNNSITLNNNTASPGGIYISGGTNLIISGNTIASNYTSGIYGGLTDSLISNNTITGTTGIGWGILIVSSGNTISGNFIASNSGPGIRLADGSSRSIVSNNILDNNSQHISLESEEMSSNDSNQITSNIIYDSSGTTTGIYVGGDFINTYLSNNTFVGNGITTPIANSGTNTKFVGQTTTTNNDLSFVSRNLGIGTTTPLATLHVSGGYGANAAMILNQTNNGDIFTASASGTPLFTLTNAGGIRLGTDEGSSGECLLSQGVGNGAVWGSCGTGGGGSNWVLNVSDGTLSPINNTLDFLLGGTATDSAKFAILGVAADTPVASVSAIGSGRGISLSYDGSIQTTLNQTLTLGGNTTGDIFLRPGNSTGMVRIIHGLTGSGGLLLTDSETDNNTKVARIKSSSYSNSAMPVSMILAQNTQIAQTLYIGGGSASEQAVTQIQLRTATALNTTSGAPRLTIDNNGLIGIGYWNLFPTATLDVKATTDGAGGTIPVASISGATSFAALVVDNRGAGNVFTASSAGQTRFTIGTEGQIGIGLSAGAPNFGSNGQCLISGGAEESAAWGSCGAGGTTDGSGLTYITDTADDFAIGANDSTAEFYFDVDNSGAATLFLGVNESKNGGLTFYSSGAGETDPTITADASGNLNLLAPTGVVRIGTDTDGLTFDYLNGGPSYSGSARPTKRITLSPEYPGAVLTDYYGAGTDTDITGSMTSDTDTTQGTTIRNYYEWSSSETASQHAYTVAVRVTLPADFSGWATSNALVVNYITGDAADAQSELEVRVFNENNATAVATSDSNNSNTSWSTVVIDDSTLDDGSSSEWDEPGETAVIYLRMLSQDDDFVRVGDIQLNYLSKF